jgi:hypothetical protein
MDMIDKRLALDTGWGDYVNKLPDSVKGTAEDLLMGKIPAGTDEEFYAFKKLSEASPNLDHNIIYDIQKQLDLNPNMTGQEYYNSLARGGSDFSVYGRYDAPKASSLLDSFGVKGVKYLDQGSRDIGEGTSNFVLFGDKGINITNKYMNPATLIGSLGAGALATGSEDSMAGEVKPFFSEVADFRRGIQRQQDINNALGANQLSDYEKGRLNYFLPDTGTVEAPNSAYRGVLDKAGMSLQNLETPLGKPFEATGNIFQDMAYGDAPDVLDAAFAPLELAGGVSNFAKNGLLSAFGADKNAQRKILEGLLKEYGY